jgi:hypothetical protein
MCQAYVLLTEHYHLNVKVGKHAIFARIFFDETNLTTSTSYSLLLVELKFTIRKAGYRAVRQVNRALIELYWGSGGK